MTEMTQVQNADQATTPSEGADFNSPPRKRDSFRRFSATYLPEVAKEHGAPSFLAKGCIGAGVLEMCKRYQKRNRLYIFGIRIFDFIRFNAPTLDHWWFIVVLANTMGLKDPMWETCT